MFTVAIDFDGVLNNLPEVWCKYLNDMYYTNQKSEQVDVPRNYNTSRKDLIKCNILVDDNPEYLRASSAYKILMSAPYNIYNTVDVDSVCNNCEEVLNVILQHHLGKSYTYSK